jgi:hypothetical protein
MNNLPIKKIDQVDRYGNKVSMEWDNSYLKKKKVQDKLGNAFTLEYAIPEVPKMGEQDVPKYDHPGEPKGTDTVPAWLTPGEFVINKEATQMYEPLIRQMNNHGRQVQEQGQPLHASEGTKVPWITDDLLDRLRFAETGNLPKNKMISSAGAVGPYQIMPHNFDGGAGFGTTSISEADAWDPNKSRQFASEYLAGIQRAFPDWSPEEVLRAYNWGPGNMRSWKKPNSGMTMPMETQQYSSKILGPGKSYADASQGKGGFDWSSLNPFGAAHAQTPGGQPPPNTNEPDKKSGGSLDGWFYRWWHGLDDNEMPPLNEDAKQTNETPEWIQDALGGAETSGGILSSTEEFTLDKSNDRKENFTQQLADGKINYEQWDKLMKDHQIRENKKYKAIEEKNLLAEEKKRLKDIELNKSKNEIEKALNNENLPESQKKILADTLQTINTELDKGPEVITPGNKPAMSSEQEKNEKARRLAIIKKLEEDKAKRKGENTTISDKAAAENAGKNAPKKEIHKAEKFLRDLLGPLFNKPELKRMAIFYAGARLMGHQHGPSLMYSLDNYVKRVDSKESAALQWAYSAQANDYTRKSIKDFMENDYDWDLLVKNNAVVKRQANYKTVYSKKNFNKSKKLEEVTVGDGSNLYKAWEDIETGTIITDTAAFWNDWTEESMYAVGSDKYMEQAEKLATKYEDAIKDSLEFYTDNAEFKKYNRINPTVQASKLARWALETGPKNMGGVDPWELGGVLSEAINFGVSNSLNSEQEFSQIKPFVKALMFDASTDHTDLFKTPLDTKTEKDKGEGDFIDMAQFTLAKEKVVRMLQKEIDPATNTAPLANTSEDLLFNMYVNDTVELWEEMDNSERDEWHKSALMSNKGLFGSKPLTSGFFEFMLTRLNLNKTGEDVE